MIYKSLFPYLLVSSKYYWTSGKQCRPWSDAAFCGVWSGSTLFAKVCLFQYWGLLQYTILDNGNMIWKWAMKLILVVSPYTIVYFLVISSGWLCEAKVSCVLRHWGVQLRLAYSWARPAILAADKSRGGMFLVRLFLYFHSFFSFSPVPLFHLLYYIFYLPSLSGRRHKMTYNGWSINQSCYKFTFSWHGYGQNTILLT